MIADACVYLFVENDACAGYDVDDNKYKGKRWPENRWRTLKEGEKDWEERRGQVKVDQNMTFTCVENILVKQDNLHN